MKKSYVVVFVNCIMSYVFAVLKQFLMISFYVLYLPLFLLLSCGVIAIIINIFILLFVAFKTEGGWSKDIILIIVQRFVAGLLVTALLGLLSACNMYLKRGRIKRYR
ncbi:hypothetical protein [Bartonella sp. B30(2025)]